MYENCACKGIRKCAICQPVKIDLEKSNEENLLQINKIFVYCFNCNKCVSLSDLNDNYIDNFLNNSNDLIHNCDLSPNESIELNGIFVKNEFINSDEEHKVVREINQNEWKDSQSGNLFFIVRKILGKKVMSFFLSKISRNHLFLPNFDGSDFNEIIY